MNKRSVVFGLLVSAVFLYLAFRKTDFGELARHLSAARYLWLLPAAALTVLSLWVRALRWGLLLYPLRPIGAGPLFSATAIGFMANNLLPMRLGELIRAWAIGRSTGVSASAAFATIVVERLFDLFTMIAVFGLLLIVAPFDNPEFEAGALLACGLGLIVLLGLVLYHLQPAWTERLAGRFLPGRARERALGLLRSFGAGLEIFRDPRRLLGTAGLTMVMWLLIVIVIKICIAAARLEEGALALPATSSLVILVVMAIGVMVPSGPGFVGTMQAAAVLGLAIVGYTDRDRALSFSILYHATQWFPVVMVGLIYLFRENLSLAQVRQAAARERLGPGA